MKTHFFAILLKSHFSMAAVLQICCIFSEHLFQRHLWVAASVNCMKKKFASKYKCAAHNESQKQTRNKNIKFCSFFSRRAFYSNMELVNNFEWTNLQKIFLKNCVFGCSRKVDESREKFINDIIKLPIIMKLLIKKKAIKLVNIAWLI